MDFNYRIIDNEIEIFEYIGFDEDEICIPTTIEGYDVISIAENTFRGLNVKHITFPERLKIIGDRAFFECNLLEDVRLPESMEVCEELAFYHCKSLKHVNMGGTKYILGHCFERCSMLEEVNVSDDAYILGVNCFAYCTSLENINIPRGLCRLEQNTFMGCKNLKQIRIPQNVSYIGNNCFRDCINLNIIEIEGMDINFESEVFICYEWKRPMKMDGSEDERYKPKSKVLETPNKTIFCLPGSSKGMHEAQKYLVNLWKIKYRRV